MDDIFRPPTSKECQARKKECLKKWRQEFESFKELKVAFKRADGSFNVRGDVHDWGSKDFRHLARRYGSIIGNFSCGGTLESLKGAPQLVVGNFNFHGELKSLRGFPKEVWGDVEFINHPIPGDKRNAKRWTASNIRKICDVRGKIRVQNHYGI